ncbi:MAG: hypothetical protein PQJ61_00910 [Spirochaetales bacterium]|uniref:Uncharacterized protein n=1 Tax=Candidatus Thalassospirochaeta sargassi TaxID=3119039 RepID=A0AAJ1MM96_9SPIO|nr:hypothetical protein [Spirochaetales bacterium]
MIATGSANAVSLNTIFPSIAVSDAFEAVTNGMHNPEVLERLADEGRESADWINMINAIQAFYKQDFMLMCRWLDEVPDDCLAGSLKKVLRHMSGDTPAENLGFYEEKLAKRITEDSRFLSSAIEQLKESIEYGEELFVETVSLLIKEVKKSPAAAESLALWSFRICIENDFDDETLADNIIMLFGQAEGLRLIGLSLLETEPESALICFTRSLIKKLVDRTLSKEDAEAALEIIGTLISACHPDDPVLIDISEMLTMLESELILFFNLGKMPRRNDPAGRVSAMLDLLSGRSADAAAEDEVDVEYESASETTTVTKEPSVSIPKGEAVQLELF